MNFSYGSLLSLLSLTTSLSAQASNVPRAKHVVVVIFENEDYENAIKNPYFTSFAERGALATNFHGETHPSQGNYIALVTGSSQGVRNDANVDLDVAHIGDSIEKAGKSWKVYAEGYPGHCFLGAAAGRYVRKHVPFVSFRNVQTDADRCGRIVDAADLDQDIAKEALPDFALYIPDLNNDGHDTGVAFADGWFKRRFETLLSDRRFMDGTLVIATFDESRKTNPTNHIYTAILGDAVLPGSRLTSNLTHVNLLKTVEEALGVPAVGAQDSASTSFAGIWRN